MASPELENNQPDDDEAFIIWEKNNIISDKFQDEIETMWEIPQICHFFHEAKEVLNLPPISIYEVERMLLIPKASKQLAAIMTCLLCSPTMKSKLRKIPPMPYKFWKHTLIQKCKNWFKIYQKHQDAIKVLESIGVEPTFWKIFPDISYIENTDFDKLTLKQKVWLLKSLCDSLMHARKTIQDEFVKHSEEEQNDMVLGTDRHGNTYFYLNQYIDTDLRIYRHKMINNAMSVVQFPTIPLNEPTTESKPVNHLLSYLSQEESSNSFDVNINMPQSPKVESEKTESSKIISKPEKHRRKKPSWKNGILPHNKKKYKMRKLAQASLQNRSNGLENGCPTDESRCSSTASFCNEATSENHNDRSVIRDVMNNLLRKIEDQESAKVKVNLGEKSSLVDEPNNAISLLLKNSECSLISVGKRKCGNDAECDNDKSDGPCITINKLPSPNKKLKQSSSNNFKDSLKRIDNQRSLLQDSNLTNFSKLERKDFWNASKSFLKCKYRCEKFKNDEQLYDGYFSLIDMKRNEKYWSKNEGNVKIENLLEDIDVSTFDLVADSVESLRDLIAFIELEHLSKFQTEDEHKIACEHKLIRRLCLLAEDLEEKEETLKIAMNNARQKLCKELIDFQKGVKEETNWLGENGILFNWWIVGAQSYNITPTQESLTNYVDKPENKLKDDHDTSREDSSSPSDKFEKRNALKKNENEEDEEDDESEEEVQKTTRVLRTRGVSSYTGHFYSDEDSEEQDTHERWSDAASSIQNNNSQNLNSSVDSNQNRKSDSQSERDSDQEWILPRNRKKKKKRQSASRRLKSLQHKIQIIPVNTILENAKQNTNAVDQLKSVDPTVNNIMVRRKSEELDIKPDISKIRINESVEDTKPLTGDLEKVDSIHSELDIPEEKPVIDPISGAIQTPNVPSTPLVKRNNIPIIASSIQLQPMQFTPQYRTPIRQQLLARAIGPHMYQYRPQQVIHRPRMCYRANAAAMDPRLMHPRPPQLPQPHPQMPIPRNVYVEQRPPVRMPPRAQQPRAYRPVQMTLPSPRMRAAAPGVPNVRAPYSPRTPQTPQGARRTAKLPPNATAPLQKSTSLIVLSDSDDEIEMIVIEKSTSTKTTTTPSKPITTQARPQKPVITSQITVDATKSILPTQMLRRMNQGGISITPLKPQSSQSTPQLVVVVNETGSHYALALPNGSKLILTPDQVAQIRASNGGNLLV